MVMGCVQKARAKAIKTQIEREKLILAEAPQKRNVINERFVSLKTFSEPLFWRYLAYCIFVETSDIK